MDSKLNKLLKKKYGLNQEELEELLKEESPEEEPKEEKVDKEETEEQPKASEEESKDEEKPKEETPKEEEPKKASQSDFEEMVKGLYDKITQLEEESKKRKPFGGETQSQPEKVDYEQDFNSVFDNIRAWGKKR